MIVNKFIVFLFLFALLLTGCDMSNKTKHPKILRFGNDQNLSDYIFENTKDNILISSSNMHPNMGENVTSLISVKYPTTITGIDDYFSVGVQFREKNKRYKDKNSVYYQKHTNPAEIEHKELSVSGMDGKKINWYKGDKKNHPNDYYTIDYDGLYDHILIHRTQMIATVCRVRTMLAEGVELDFHFKTEGSPEDDLHLIDFVINDILSHLKPLEGQ